jgi:hypothetical protein
MVRRAGAAGSRPHIDPLSTAKDRTPDAATNSSEEQTAERVLIRVDAEFDAEDLLNHHMRMFRSHVGIGTRRYSATTARS